MYRRKIQRYLARDKSDNLSIFCQFRKVYVCGPIRSSAARVHLSPCAPQIILRVSRFNLRLYDRVARSRRRQSPPLLIPSLCSKESEWPLSAVPGSSAGLERVSAVHPRLSIVDRSHPIVNRSFEPAASIRRSAQQAPTPAFYAPKWFSISPRINATGICYSEMECVMSLSFGVDATRIKRLTNLFAKGRSIKAIKRSMPLTLSLTYRRSNGPIHSKRSGINSDLTPNLFVWFTDSAAN